MERNTYVNFIPLTAAEELAKKINYRHEKQLEAKLRCIEQEEKYASSILNKKYSVMNKEVERLYLTRQNCLSYISLGDNGELCIQLNRKPAVKTDRYSRPTMMSSSMKNRYFHKDRNSLFNMPSNAKNGEKTVKQRTSDSSSMPSIDIRPNIICKDSIRSNMVDKRIALRSNLRSNIAARAPTRSSLDSESSSCSSRSSRNSSPSSERQFHHQTPSRLHLTKSDIAHQQVDKLPFESLYVRDGSSDDENLNKTLSATDDKSAHMNRPSPSESNRTTDLNRPCLPSPSSCTRPLSSKSAGRHSEYDELYVIEEVERENIVQEKNKKNRRNLRVRSFSAIERSASCEKKHCCKLSSTKEA